MHIYNHTPIRKWHMRTRQNHDMFDLDPNSDKAQHCTTDRSGRNRDITHKLRTKLAVWIRKIHLNDAYSVWSCSVDSVMLCDGMNQTDSSFLSSTYAIIHYPKCHIFWQATSFGYSFVIKVLWSQSKHRKYITGYSNILS